MNLNRFGNIANGFTSVQVWVNGDAFRKSVGISIVFGETIDFDA